MMTDIGLSQDPIFMCTLHFILFFLGTYSVWFSALFSPHSVSSSQMYQSACHCLTSYRVFGLCVWLMLFPLPEMLCFLNVHKLFFLKRSLIPTCPPPDAVISHFFKYSLQPVLCGTSMLCHRILMIWVLISLILYFPSCLTQCLEHVQCVYGNI